MTDAAADIRATAERRARPVRLEAVALGVLCVIDVMLVRRWFFGDAGIGAALASHFAAVAAVTGIAFILRAADRGRMIVLAAQLVLLGPLGAPAILAARTLFAAQRPLDLADRAARQESRDAAHEIVDDIEQGRRRIASIGSESFVHIFEGEDRAAQVAALSALCRHFRPEMRAGLDTALRSRYSPLKVQAAAVFAHLRTRHSVRAAELLARTGGLSGEDAAEAGFLIASGFLDSGTAARLANVAAPDTARSYQQPRAPLFRAAEVRPRLKRYSCGGLG